MSVLSFPRIYFKGYMKWDPCTFNNNDWVEFPTFDPVKVALNWDFLAGHDITPANFTTTFRPWARSLQPDDNPNDPPGGPRVPAEWNMFGTHGVACVQYGEFTTTITGGDLAYGQPVTSDPLIGGPVAILGDGGKGSAKLVDTNPVSPWSSQIYFGQLAFGTGAATITGTRARRMHSRWLNPSRVYDPTAHLTQPAASIGVCFQTGIPADLVTWPGPGTSALATGLQAAASAPGAIGIMVRFTAYVNVYFVNGILNSIPAQPRDYPSLATALAAAWEAFDTDGSTKLFFSNPCYSHLVGTVGVWNEGELASAPGGRCLNAAAPVAPVTVEATGGPAAPALSAHGVRPGAEAASGPATVPLGPVAAMVDETTGLLSLDLGSTIPEVGTPAPWPSDLDKADFGPLTVGVVNDGAFTAIADIPYDGYDRAAYEARAGIVDIPLPETDLVDLLRTGSLAIQAQGQTALAEQVLTAETDDRGIYLDQGGQAEFEVQACRMGTPCPGVSILVARYDSGLNLVPVDQPQLVEFTNGAQQTVTVGSITTGVTVVTTGPDGTATVAISAQSPGMPVLGFFPYTGATLPEPPASFNFVDDAFYTTVRVLPFDDDLPGQFIELWNTSHDQSQAWDFVYDHVLYVYDMVFSVMLKFVDLGSQEAVQANAAAIARVIAADLAEESTSAMPVTRDLSAGRRLTLQLYLYLVANSFDVPTLSVDAVREATPEPTR